MMILTLLALVAALTFLTSSPASADEANMDEPFRVSGNVQNKGEPLGDVSITVTGPGGYEVQVDTDDEGKWRVGVPEKAEYEVTL
ncbi:MAG TPA: branched-chain amino acid ABC transporter permease, partial [Naasia sp.]